jgi:hypothetical protein
MYKREDRQWQCGSALFARNLSFRTGGQRTRLDLVRLPQLTDKPQRGKYRVQEGRLPRFGFSISRADAADFMIEAAEKRAFIGKVVGVCN